MRIALVSTSAVAVPPVAYGGTELIVAELAKMLTRLGHHVTVFATGDSRTEAELRWHFRSAQWPPDPLRDLQHSAAAWEEVLRTSPPFDVVHVHQAAAVAFSRVCPIPTVLTLHYESTERETQYYASFPDVTYVAISRRQAELAPALSVCQVVHHGLDIDLYEEGSAAGGWLAFVGRLAPEKGPQLAIDVARDVGVPLHMGGRPHESDRSFFATEVEPRLQRAGDLVRWQGEVSLGPKQALLGGARVTLFPITWEEPFGLVMIESMLLGTPVIAFARGAAPEVVEEGVTGFLVHDTREMADRVRRIHTLDRRRCRDRARERWGSRRMTLEYLHVYDVACRSRFSATSDTGRRVATASPPGAPRSTSTKCQP